MKNITNVLEYLEHSAERFPDKPAYIDAQSSYTFSELERAARAVGSALCGVVQKGCPVAVYMEKSVQQIAAFFGVAYAGAFYSPIDVDMPAQRAQMILDTLETPVVIASNNSAEKLREMSYSGRVVLFDEIQFTPIDNEKLADIRRRGIDSDPLYAIFTSGSTGVPKGVVISQRSTVNLTEWFCSAFQFTEEEIFGNQTPFYFDGSIKEIYATLKSGATMYIIPKRLFTFPAKLLEYVNERKINCVMWVPSVLCFIVDFHTFKKVKPLYLRKVIFFGEAMPTKQFNLWRREFPEICFGNLYGPTEATVDSAYYIVKRELRDDEPIPIGYACENTDILILNEKNEPVKEGELGEICVRGVSLALGYYNDPEKTGEVFVQNPLQKHYRELIYRTGDLGRYNEYGEIIYAARKDFQIKHMGHRIELGEIETAVGAVSGVRRVCCLYDMQKGKIVCIYEGDVTDVEIINAIKQTVPKYMIPNIYHSVAEMPVNMSGKIDRPRLTEEFIHGTDQVL